jgi:hypothetical protein
LEKEAAKEASEKEAVARQNSSCCVAEKAAAEKAAAERAEAEKVAAERAAAEKAAAEREAAERAAAERAAAEKAAAERAAMEALRAARTALADPAAEPRELTREEAIRSELLALDDGLKSGLWTRAAAGRRRILEKQAAKLAAQRVTSAFAVAAAAKGGLLARGTEAVRQQLPMSASRQRLHDAKRRDAELNA